MGMRDRTEEGTSYDKSHFRRAPDHQGGPLPRLRATKLRQQKRRRMSDCGHEFNSGFVSALAKFLAHQQQFSDIRQRKLIEHDIRVYAAADHLMDLELPTNLSSDLRHDITGFVEGVLAVRLSFDLAWDAADSYFQRADELLQIIDKEVFNLEHVCSHYP